jgi:hypothetical protein
VIFCPALHRLSRRFVSLLNRDEIEMCRTPDALWPTL